MIAIDAICGDLIAAPSYGRTLSIQVIIVAAVRERRGSHEARAHSSCSLNSGSLLSLSVAAIFPLGRAAMSDGDVFKGEPQPNRTRSTVADERMI